MNKYVPEKIASLEEYVPQNDKCDIILDANENPFDLPENVKRKISAELLSLPFNRYPDPKATALREKYAELYSLNADCIVAGNGSDELISIITGGFLSPEDTVVTVAPDFSMYAFYSYIVGAKIKTFVKGSDFSIDFNALSQTVKDSKAKAVIFSNPCNPTGRAYLRNDVLRFVDGTDALVIVDEAYMEFCGKNCSVFHDAPSRDNLIILKTLSKAFGLAGLRVGFAISCSDIAGAINKIRSPYNVNSFSQLASCIALDFNDETRKIIGVIKNEKARLLSAFSTFDELSGLKFSDTNTNFLLLDFTNAFIASGEFYNRLLYFGIRVRLMKNYVRITVGTPCENDRLIAAVRKIFTAGE